MRIEDKVRYWLSLTAIFLAGPALAAGSPVCVIVDTSGNCVSTAHPLPIMADGGIFTANITQWASGVLGAMANYGTSPGLVLVPGVNAFVTNTIPVTGTFWQSTQPISAVSLPLPTGAMPSSGGTVGISGTLPAFTSTPTFNIGTAPTIAVTGTFFQATQPISAVSLPLPTNSAQETGGNLATLAGSITSNVIQSNVKQVNGIATSTGAGAVGTGSQRVVVGQDTTTIAGSAPGTAGSASANVVTVQGAASMTPISVGNALGVTPTDRTIASPSGSSQQIMAANASRHSLTIENTGNANCGVNPTGGTAAIGGAGTLTLAPLGSYSPRIPTLSAVTIICTAAQPIYGEEN